MHINRLMPGLMLRCSKSPTQSFENAGSIIQMFPNRRSNHNYLTRHWCQVSIVNSISRVYQAFNVEQIPSVPEVSPVRAPTGRLWVPKNFPPPPANAAKVYRVRHCALTKTRARTTLLRHPSFTAHLLFSSFYSSRAVASTAKMSNEITHETIKG